MKGTPLAMSLNDVCCYIPAWFGVSSSIFLGLLTGECSGSWNAAVAAAGIMAVIPAHIMRSVGGGYDNESVAVTAMCMTFYFWCRALRPGNKEDGSRATDGSWPIGIVAGLAYIYMVAAWGGYIFVINMIGVHAIALVFLGRYSVNLRRAYSLFFVIGTFGATRVPVVGWAPLKSLEQLGPFGVFLFMQLFEVCEYLRAQKRKEQNGRELSHVEVFKLRSRVFGAAAAASMVFMLPLYWSGYFGPLSSRVRGLFVKHTRTGNPLVDSVAEHQPASSDAYWQFLHKVCYVAPPGFLLSLRNRTDSKLFLTLYGITAYYFANKMMRLVILMGPIASALGGMCVAFMFEWIFAQFWPLIEEHLIGKSDDKKQGSKDDEAGADAADDSSSSSSSSNGPASPSRGGKKGSKGKKGKKGAAAGDDEDWYKPQPGSRKKRGSPETPWELMGGRELEKLYDSQMGQMARKGLAVALSAYLVGGIPEFWSYSHVMATHMSNPSIMYQAQLRDGSTIMVDDYREAYWWLRDNTPEDARVMAWWDYGYQITGIGNRTTIADGNTWNHEHIATLGRCLTSPEKEAHRIVRHLADYVLVWTGGGGDDLAKSPHMARIGNSVFHDICPGDPTCSTFGFIDRQGTPTPMMAASLLYKLHGHNQRPGVRVDKNRFKEVYTSKYNKVRIFKVLHVSHKSKAWVADPANRVCDAPGSWYCTGQYPPALDKVIKKRKNFKQLEDFNVERDELDDEYNKEYHARMSGKSSKGSKLEEKQRKLKAKQTKEEEATKAAKKKAAEEAEKAAEEEDEAAEPPAAASEPEPAAAAAEEEEQGEEEPAAAASSEPEPAAPAASEAGDDDDDDDDDDDIPDEDDEDAKLTPEEIAELYGAWLAVVRCGFF